MIPNENTGNAAEAATAILSAVIPGCGAAKCETQAPGQHGQAPFFRRLLQVYWH